LLRNQEDKDNPAFSEISWTPVNVGAHHSAYASSDSRHWNFWRVDFDAFHPSQ
jgi:hypothetical protein